MTGNQFKKIREERRLTQTELAKELNVSLKTIQNWEGDKTKIPHDAVVAMEAKAEKQSNAVKYTFSADNIMDVPLVNQYAYAGYLAGYTDDDFIQHLPRMPWVIDRERKGNYLCFEMKGDSMNDGSHESYLPGDILLGREVRKDYWRSKLHIDKWDFIIVTPGEGILFKRIIKHDVEKGIITLHSLNDEYEDFEMYLKDISQIFNVVDIKRNVQRR